MKDRVASSGDAGNRALVHLTPSAGIDSGGERWRLCTVTTKAAMQMAVAMAHSFGLHHPRRPVTALVVDAAPGDCFSGLPFECLGLDQLGMSSETVGQMATYYDAVELSAALKPFLLRYLIDAGRDDAVMYLDQSVEVFAPLDDLFERARRNVVVTPQVLTPTYADMGEGAAETTLLQQGQFNLGFVALGPSSRGFLQYWSERTRLFTRRDPERGYFLDQRWVDIAPSLFEFSIVRDPACNVGYWNLHERGLERDSTGEWQVGGRALRFFNFAGHDLRHPYQFADTPHAEAPARFDLSDDMRTFLRDRCDRVLHAAGYVPERAVPYQWNRSASGIELTRTVRQLYWTAVRDAEREGIPAPPHAFHADDRGFSAWLREPAWRGSPISRYAYVTWERRPDLRAKFPQLAGADLNRFAEWASNDPAAVYTTPPTLRGAAPLPRRRLPGVNLVSYLDGGHGLGSASRMLARMIRAAGVPVGTDVVRTGTDVHRYPFAQGIHGTPFDVTIIAINADGLQDYAATPEYGVLAHTKKIGVWYWEAGVFPRELWSAFDLVDEVWCASDHVYDMLTQSGRRSVQKHPLIVERSSTGTALLKSDLGLPEDRFLFGFAFDYASVMERKNPLGLIDAYQRAFGPEDGAALVLKTINAAYRPSAAAAVRAAAGAREDIVFLDHHLNYVEMRAWFRLLDCYVSLHRSEGLGLTIAEAMAAGKPAIATGWSGNLEFMTSDNSRLLPYELVEVGPNVPPYPPLARWADVDLETAANAMRDVYDDPVAAAELGDRGQNDVTSAHTVAAAATWFADRFAELCELGA